MSKYYGMRVQVATGTINHYPLGQGYDDFPSAQRAAVERLPAVIAGIRNKSFAPRLVEIVRRATE